MIGRIDVHSHLLPQRDDGCQSLEESLACARRMVELGYTHIFCTPHIWPSLPDNTARSIPPQVTLLQRELDRAQVPLKLLPGGELNLRPEIVEQPPEDIISYAMAGKYVLADIWAEKLPAFFDPTIRWLQQQGFQVILAHPERMRAVQDDPELADHFAELGILLQGNFQCLSDPPEARTRQVIERYLEEDRYFLLGSDLHRWETLQVRIDGLHRAEKLIGPDKLRTLIEENPTVLMA